MDQNNDGADTTSREPEEELHRDVGPNGVHSEEMATHSTNEEEEFLFPFPVQDDPFQEIAQWRADIEEALRARDGPRVRRLLNRKRLPGLTDDYTFTSPASHVINAGLWMEQQEGEAGDELELDEDHQLDELEVVDQEVDEEGGDVIEFGNEEAARQAQALARLMYSGLPSVFASALGLFIEEDSAESIESCLQTISSIVCEDDPHALISTKATQKAFNRIWEELQDNDAKRMLVFCGPKRGMPALPMDLLRNIQSFLFDREKDLLRILVRDSVIVKLGMVLESNKIPSVNLKRKALTIIFDLSKSSTRIELVRDTLLFDSLLRMLGADQMEDLRVLAGGILTNVMDREDSACEACSGNTKGVVSCLVQLLNDRRLMTVQTLTNLSNYAATREILLQSNVLDTIYDFEPFNETAELFRQMCLSNLHVDATFSNRNRFGADTSKLRLNPQRPLAGNYILRVFWDRLEYQRGAFRLDEPLLSLMAMLWDPVNRSLLCWTNLVRCLVEALMEAHGSKDRLSFKLALGCLETVCRTVIVEGDDEATTRDKFHMSIMGLLYFIQRVLMASSRRESPWLFTGLSPEAQNDVESLIESVAEYATQLERRSERQMDMVD